MTIALFLHLYQPPTQFPAVLKDITRSSYRPILSLLKKYPSAKITFNISGSLTEQLAQRSDLQSILADLADLAGTGQVELVGSAAYHPLLTEIPEDEVRRQIRLNNEINRKYFGDVWRPRGFFPPEMAVDEQVLKIVADEGFEWVAVDESAVEDSSIPTSVFRILSSDLFVVLRNSSLSVKVAFSEITTVDELAVATNASPLVLAMDGETFGHHRPEQMEFLEELFADARRDVEMQTISHVLSTYQACTVSTVKKSAWGPWERWFDANNPLHKMQWELTDLAVASVNRSRLAKTESRRQKADQARIAGARAGVADRTLWGGRRPGLPKSGAATASGIYSDPSEEQWLKARKMLDRSLHSDQYWWASADPFWHPEMVKRGAQMLRDAVLAVPDASDRDRKKARRLYKKIVNTGLKLHGSEIIDMH